MGRADEAKIVVPRRQGESLARRTFCIAALLGLALAFAPCAWAADRGPIISGETKTDFSLSGPSYMDTWTFTAAAGDRVAINAVAVSGTLDTEIILYPPDNGPAEIRSNCRDIMGFYSGCADQLDHELLQTGTYTVLVQDYQVNHPGAYDISFLTIPGPVSFPGDRNGGAIVSGATLAGAINVASDMDAFQFSANAGDHMVLNAVTTSGSLDTEIILYPPDNGPAEIRSSCRDIMGFYHGCADQLDHQLLQTGLYTAVVQDYQLNHAGTYNVSLTKFPPTLGPSLHNPTPQNASRLADLSGSFGWEAVPGATCYDLYLGEGAPAPLEKIGDCLPTSSKSFPPLTVGKVYYWRVVAHTLSGGINGPYWWFEVPTVETGWLDDFEPYALGSFPWRWTDYVGGSGVVVDDDRSVSGSRSLRLDGPANSVAGATRKVGMASAVKLEARIFASSAESVG